jgi:cytidylate kinase
VKLYVTASVEARARRRFLEMRTHGRDVTLAQILADLAARDARDMQRAEAPLQAAPDAVVLDTSDLDRDAAVAAAVALVADRAKH